MTCKNFIQLSPKNDSSRRIAVAPVSPTKYWNTAWRTRKQSSNVTGTFLLAMQTMKRLRVHFLSLLHFNQCENFTTQLSPWKLLLQQSKQLKNKYIKSRRSSSTFSVLTSGTVGTTLLRCYCLVVGKRGRGDF